jgi:hypothetical protein
VKRNHSIERALRWRFWQSESRPTYVIPPKSVIRLFRKEEGMEGLNVGDNFRIGYYSKQDGPNIVWLVNDAGDYLQTWDQQSLLDYFKVVERSDETDTYGTHRALLGPR